MFELDDDERFTQISFSLRPTLKARVDRYARQQDMTRAQVIRKAITEYLESRDGDR